MTIWKGGWVVGRLGVSVAGWVLGGLVRGWLGGMNVNVAGWLGGWAARWLDGWVIGWWDAWVAGWMGGWVVRWLGGLVPPGRSVARWLGHVRICIYVFALPHSLPQITPSPSHNHTHPFLFAPCPPHHAITHIKSHPHSFPHPPVMLRYPDPRST